MFAKKIKETPEICVIGDWQFQKRMLVEYTGSIQNPSRGWYRMYKFKAECKPDFSQLKWCACTDETLALLLIDLSAYRDSHIINCGIENIRQIFRFFISCGKELIVRFTYDTEGKGLEREPSNSSQIQEHMRQIGVVIREFPGAFLCLQGLFIGSWGEMHHSSYLSVEEVQKLTSTIWKAVWGSLYLSVRSPQLWRMIFHKKSFMHPMRKKIGLFDDALFGSPTHLGTFAEEEKDSYDELEKWDQKKEMDFIDELCKVAPIGGEAIYSEEGKQIDHVIATMRKMRLTYLNCEYDEDLLNYWKQTKWAGETPDDPWRGRTVYNYIEDHLGYRLVVRSVKIKKQPFGVFFNDKEEYRKGALRVEATIENIGFSSLYHETELYFVVEGDNGNVCFYLLTNQLWDLQGGETKTYTCLFMPEKGRIYLQIKKLPDDQPILFANESFKPVVEDGEEDMRTKKRPKGMYENSKKYGLLLGRLRLTPEEGVF